MEAPKVYERIVVDRPADANETGPVRAKPPETVAEMARLRGGGVSMPEIGRRYGVSTRTVYRYLERGDLVEIEVGDWTATFLSAGPSRPRRVSSWRPR